jgi:hypothetical protein
MIYLHLRLMVEFLSGSRAGFNPTVEPHDFSVPPADGGILKSKLKSIEQT